ncbi:hypothetical protein T11_15201, partial [Trichinella zimbabwensis]
MQHLATIYYQNPFVKETQQQEKQRSISFRLDNLICALRCLAFLC